MRPGRIQTVRARLRDADNVRKFTRHILCIVGHRKCASRVPASNEVLVRERQSNRVDN